MLTQVEGGLVSRHQGQPARPVGIHPPAASQEDLTVQSRNKFNLLLLLFYKQPVRPVGNLQQPVQGTGELNLNIDPCSIQRFLRDCYDSSFTFRQTDLWTDGLSEVKRQQHSICNKKLLPEFVLKSFWRPRRQRCQKSVLHNRIHIKLRTNENKKKYLILFFQFHD